MIGVVWQSIIHTYIHTHTHAHMYWGTCIHTHIHTSIHPYIHTYIHTYIDDRGRLTEHTGNRGRLSYGRWHSVSVTTFFTNAMRHNAWHVIQKTKPGISHELMTRHTEKNALYRSRLSSTNAISHKSWHVIQKKSPVSVTNSWHVIQKRTPCISHELMTRHTEKNALYQSRTHDTSYRKERPVSVTTLNHRFNVLW